MEYTTLAIGHSLFLTREERYALFNGESICVIGVSVPVWFYKGVTSEPAIEVFANYKLSNSDHTSIKHVKTGYEIVLPKHLPYDKQFDPQGSMLPSLDMLLDIKEGGNEFLAFSQYNKVRKDKKVLKDNKHYYFNYKKIFN